MNKYTYHLISIILIMLLFFILLIFPGICISGVNTGIRLCITALMPSIFPFILLSNIIMQLGVIHIIGKILYPVMHLFFHTSLYGGYAVFMGFCCGYPIGAKVVNDLLEQKLITPEEANRIICFSNNASPGYVQNYLLISLLGLSRPKIQFILLYYCPVILYGILSGIHKDYGKTSGFMDIPSGDSAPSSSRQQVFSIKTLDCCILDSFKIMVKLCGYLIIFSILSAFIYQKLPLGLPVKYLLTSLCEITTGAYYISQSAFSINTKAVCCIACTLFGGLSTFMQTRSVCTNHIISLKKYIATRLLFSICTIPIFIILNKNPVSL